MALTPADTALPSPAPVPGAAPPSEAAVEAAAEVAKAGAPEQDTYAAVEPSGDTVAAPKGHLTAPIAVGVSVPGVEGNHFRLNTATEPANDAPADDPLAAAMEQIAATIDLPTPATIATRAGPTVTLPDGPHAEKVAALADILAAGQAGEVADASVCYHYVQPALDPNSARAKAEALIAAAESDSIVLSSAAETLSFAIERATIEGAPADAALTLASYGSTYGPEMTLGFGGDGERLSFNIPSVESAFRSDGLPGLAFEANGQFSRAAAALEAGGKADEAAQVGTLAERVSAASLGYPPPERPATETVQAAAVAAWAESSETSWSLWNASTSGAAGYAALPTVSALARASDFPPERVAAMLEQVYLAMDRSVTTVDAELGAVAETLKVNRLMVRLAVEEMAESIEEGAPRDAGPAIGASFVT